MYPNKALILYNIDSQIIVIFILIPFHKNTWYFMIPNANLLTEPSIYLFTFLCVLQILSSGILVKFLSKICLIMHVFSELSIV